ncbi:MULTISPECIES: hybrid sensor histidine kinase/response regulator [unclassified Leptolyngbya]|uniref:hybrid sensor histidine kinase/response regulator n=1 Tax=unclassified Leptolyngbya TaxID=2650499 RepID=UPI001688BCA2|nr:MULTISPECIES: hybrid sensor histidine kinase/response regulator [unclassified Leptolyngbya]MBD1911105.1 hybrid sensor histidine kinase/response regulator [Leptolyngbya sp. FACHB-8]MBD2157087.1 hybrid sensor histidine kinase/response regulator [Leptolyngbya sp. FACHB-16]
MPDYSMLDLFRQEVIAQVENLKQHLLMFQQQSQSAQDIQGSLQALHALDGLAQVVNVEAAVVVIQAIQSRLRAVQQGIDLSAVEVDRLLEAAHWLLDISLLDEPQWESWLSGHRESIAAIQSVYQPVTSESDYSDPSSGSVAGIASSEDENLPEVEDSVADSVPEPLQAHLPLVDPQMMDLFRMEVEEQANILNDGLLTLETQPTATQPLEALMRAAHSIKGAARIVGLDAAVSLAHTLEDCFVAAQNRTLTLSGDLIDQLLRGVDLLQGLSQVSDRHLSTWLTQQNINILSVQSGIEALHQSSVHSENPASFDESEHSFNHPAVKGSSNGISDAAHQIPVGISSQSSGANSSVSEQLAYDASKGAQRVVRVGADNLNRIMGLAGEALIEANALPAFADALMQVRSHQIELATSLEVLEQQALPHFRQADQALFEMVRRQEQQCRALLSDRLSDLEEFIRRTTHLSDRLYREVITSHMRPFEEGVQNFSRMVRDLARSLDKQARLEIVGKSTSVDRDILSKLEAPITHILRNAIGHGIELPEARIAAGKPPEGRIRLEAVHRGGMLAITATDDGAGIDIQRLREQAIARQLTTPEIAEKLSDAELMEFLFLPGFSLSQQVTELSGRGVGLDIVKSMAQEVGGTVRMTSQPGKGTSFHFQLPLTLSVVRTLLIEVGGEIYAFPLSRIDHIVTVKQEDIFTVENRQYFTLEHQNVGLLPLYHVLDLPPPTAVPDPLWVVIISDQSATYGLAVDRCLGERELVVRPLDPRLGNVQDVAAAALMGDGSLILILDVSDLLRSLNTLLVDGRLAKTGETRSRKGNDAKRVLVVDDSITVREMERKLLQNHGYVVDVAVDGMEGWNAVRSYPYDLVISDIDMPRMNGIDLIKEIKKHSRLQSIPVIVVSYRDREDDRIQGLEAGADYYLTKNSFHDDTLIRAVADLVGE